MTDLTFFTNENGRTLADRFKKILQNNTQFFDVLVGYFRATGFYELYKALENVEHIRILVGINVDEETLILNNIEKFEYLPPKQMKKFTRNSIKKEMEESDDNLQINIGVKKFIEYIKSKKMEIRVYPHNKIHAKVYIMRKDMEKSEDFGKVITGSSNFTYNGLIENLEFNVELKNNSDVSFALEKFEKLWEQSIEISSEYVEILEKETWIRDDITPYEIYLKFLHEYFIEEINEDLKTLDNSDLPNNFINYKYQTDAVIQAKRMLNKYNGVFLPDVVGLGKTFITALLARSLNDGKKLIICPPVLISYWQDVLNDFGVSAKVVSLGSLDKIIDFASDYKYIFIDEAHRFRNDDNDSYTKLHEICVNKKVILISATPQNNSPKDILNLITLFQNKNSSNIIDGTYDIESFFNGLINNEKKAKKIYKNNPNIYTRAELTKVIKDNSEIIREKVLKKVMVRRLRNEIKTYYKKDLESLGLSFPKIGSPFQITYTFDKETNEVFEKLLNLIANLKYSRYNTLVYLKNKTNIQNTRIVGQNNMKGFMKSLLLKRLESSFYAFRNTIKRFKESYEKFLQMYDSGTVYISKKYNVYDLIEIDDEKLEFLISQGDVEKYSSDEFKKTLRKDLLKDLEILNDMYEKILSLGEKDNKLSHFLHELEINDTLKHSKIIIFTESKETAMYLAKKIEKNLNRNVISYTGSSSLIKKDEIIANFDPNYKGTKEDKYDILVATDVLSEGINLHRSNVIINYDLPWNPTRIMQRVGRINRVGSEFPRLFIYNFFPTSKTDDHLSLKDNIINKIQAFHNTLGEDSKYISDEEEIDSFGLYDKMMANLDDEDEDFQSELGYLSLIRDIRDNDRKLYEKIVNLPKKSRSSKKYNSKNNATISFLKNKDAKRIYITNEKDFSSKELNFFEAVEYFKSDINTKLEKIDNRFYEMLEYNKTKFKKDLENSMYYMPKSKGANNIDTKVMKFLEFLLQYKDDFSDDRQEKLEEIEKVIKLGKLSKRILKQINDINKKASILYGGDINKILEATYQAIPKEYFNGNDMQENRNIGKIKVLLSEYLIGEKDNGKENNK